MKRDTLYEEYMKNDEFERLMVQEGFILEVTEDICKVLEEKGTKRAALAEKLGKTKGYVSQLLNSGRNMTLRTLADIAYVLGYRVTIRFNKKNERKKANSFFLDWNLKSNGKLPENTINVADDYLYSPKNSGQRFSRLGS